MKPDRIFLIVFVSLSFLGIALVGAFNYFIDPFEYFDAPRIAGFNEKKMIGNAQERFDRVVGIIVKKPQALMLGSSRVRAGFQASYYSQLAGYPAYKAAVSGARFHEVFDYFEHAIHNQPDLKAVFINLDFFAFSKNLDPIAEYAPERMRRTSLSIPDLFKLLFSKSSIDFSYAIYHHNQHPEELETPARYHLVLDKGDYIGINPIVVENPQLLLKDEKRLILKKYVIDEKKVEMFKKIVDTCQAKNIDLKVAFSPAHAHYWEAVVEEGRWEDLENLKRQLCAIYPIYDFSGFTPLNRDVVSLDKESLYFHEVSHFTAHYGKIILDRVYGVEDHPHSGFLLTPETIENHLLTMREQRDDWYMNVQN